MANVIVAPERDNLSKCEHSIFLAGSIEMDKAEEWQLKVIQEFSDIEGINILNPRRKNWDSTWEQTITNPQFKEQVVWELEGLESADFIFFYFQPGTYSPITLMELGYVVEDGGDIFVCCPEGFWRKGNVDIICERNGVTVYNDLNKSISVLKDRVREFKYED